MIISIFSMFLPPFSNIGIASKTLMACCHCSAFLQALINALQLTTSAVTCTAAIDLKSCRACCHSLVPGIQGDSGPGIQLGQSTVSRLRWAESASAAFGGSKPYSITHVWPSGQPKNRWDLWIFLPKSRVHRDPSPTVFSIAPSWGKMTRNCEIWELCWWLDRVGYHCGSSF